MIPERPGLSGPTAEASWRNLRDTLESFVARRVAPRDVDDVLQDVLIRVLTGAPVREDERWASWVFTVARNAVTDHHRRTGRRSAREVDDDEELAAPTADADDEALYARAAACAAGFVHNLPGPYREALALTDLDGVSQREAAERLGLSYSGLKTRVQRGRDKLRELVTKCCHVETDVRSRVVGFVGTDAPPESDRPSCGTTTCGGACSSRAVAS